ncbi:MAG: hypothetical protein LBQ50_06115 [Planctomycetaceae bacterium]|nr:hypothetical protein [Planctomycetaceae bacterium]
MRNRRCSAAQPPDRILSPTTKSRSDDIIKRELLKPKLPRNTRNFTKNTNAVNHL